MSEGVSYCPRCRNTVKMVHGLKATCAKCGAMMFAIHADDQAPDPVNAQLDPYEVRIGGVKADPYRIGRAYGITDPILFQAVKKLLRCGRKHKDIRSDVREAITTLKRWEEMAAEDDGQQEGTEVTEENA